MSQSELELLILFKSSSVKKGGIALVAIRSQMCVRFFKMKQIPCNASITFAYHPAISNIGCAVVSAEDYKLCFFVAMEVTASADCK